MRPSSGATYTRMAGVVPSFRYTGEPGNLQEQPGTFFHIGYPSST